MPRIAYQLRIRPGREADYDLAHQHVWPELLAELSAAGVRDYSIFRRFDQLLLVLDVPDFAALRRTLAASAVNQRWQAHMAPLFAPVPGLPPGLAPDDDQALFHEVFFLPGDPAP